MMQVDLHLHSTFSDGRSSIEQLVLEALHIGLDVISFTDHDSIEGVGAEKMLCSKYGLGLIAGVEITSKNFHILGYGFDDTNDALISLIHDSAMYQTELTLSRVDSLHQKGIPVTRDDLVNTFHSISFNKSHIARYLLENAICREYIFETYGKKDMDSIVSDILSLDKKDNYSIDIGRCACEDEVIGAIHDAGGVAIIAQPFLEVRNPAALDNLVDAGLDGIEVQPFYGAKNDSFIEYAMSRKLIISYGSNYHASCIPKPILGLKGNNVLHERLKKYIYN